MKLVIEIPEAKLKALQVGEKNGVGIGTLERAVLDGIPIPETLENNIMLWDSFPEALRDLHIEHEIDLTEDEQSQTINIFIRDERAKVDRVLLIKRFVWDDIRQSYNPYFGWKLDITTEILPDADAEADVWIRWDRERKTLTGIKNLDQLFEAVFGKSVSEFKSKT